MDMLEEKDRPPMNIPEETVLAVKKGAAWLDEYMPGWEYKVNLRILSLNSSCRCVLGQLFGEYSVGLKAIVRSENIDEYSLLSDWSSEHGFIIHVSQAKFGHDQYWRAWSNLDEAWINLIQERRGVGCSG